MEELLKGRWRVALDGYRWTKTKDGRFLTAGPLARWRAYAPFEEEPSLFIKVSEFEPTETSILEFANQYGLLVGETIALADGKVAAADRFRTWEAAIVTMRHAVGVWTALKQGDRKSIERWFALKDCGSFVDVVYRPDEAWPIGVGCISAQFIKDELDLVWQFGESKGEPDLAAIPTNSSGAALAWLLMNVREHLREHAAPSFHYLPQSKNLVPAGLSIVPKNLLGAMWLQFARSIEGNVRYQRCRECQRWFKVSAKALRQTTAYCSARCRVKRNRAEKAANKGKKSRVAIKKGGRANT